MHPNIPVVNTINTQESINYSKSNRGVGGWRTKTDWDWYGEWARSFRCNNRSSHKFIHVSISISQDGHVAFSVDSIDWEKGQWIIRCNTSPHPPSAVIIQPHHHHHQQQQQWKHKSQLFLANWDENSPDFHSHKINCSLFPQPKKSNHNHHHHHPLSAAAHGQWCCLIHIISSVNRLGRRFSWTAWQ